MIVSKALLICLVAASALGVPPDGFETVKTSNAAILNKLGLRPLSNGHHRKRLARPKHDSHIYVVKLPASSTYYRFSKPHQARDDDKVNISNPDVSFNNNGRPDKIYHWNLPIVKKFKEKKKSYAKWLNYPAEKKVHRSSPEKSYRSAVQHKKKAASTSYYYAPSKNVKSPNSVYNDIDHFNGNGKPKALYVMEKSRQPAYYHPLLP